MKNAIIVLLAGVVACTILQPVLAADGATTKEKAVYSFCSWKKGDACRDGEFPSAAVIDVNDALYGTTAGGGAHGSGTVFMFDRKTGAETVLHSFCSVRSCRDGAVPSASLTNINGVLYGTTVGGGVYGGGTVFALDPATGTERSLYSFCSKPHCTDGMDPKAPLIAMKGKLYSTTEVGGAFNEGTVFSVDPNTGDENVLYSFCTLQNCTDGDHPMAGLIDVRGTLYGTTYFGGDNDSGTVFALDPHARAETVLYSFCSQKTCGDGAYPEAALTSVNGMLYGTTNYGGTHGDFGTIFTIDPGTGTETVLHSFGSGTDGRWLYSSLTTLEGLLYGTTQAGGANGQGTVFALDPTTGTETVVYSFCSQTDCPDGATPNGLFRLNRTLYGTTGAGGANMAGTVFRLTTH